MTNATPLRRTLSALAATTLLAGGLLLGQAVTAPPAQAAGHVICKPTELRTQAHELRAKAAKLDRLGERQAARKARAQATALEKKAKACEDSDNSASKPFPR
ncbi:hypothetical protein [Streptomyces roseicoloratus]|uniref:Secreted protein n=1 Tax=Streptomyces roseicoloratus TaxID=2508722 RepID=A0ABY9RQE3_9ACTN|nr:hypothetical protein [Streptomyces roseicoloratus]WMX44147.1 hypothetical protein RGF97_03730 [Streptomyces roseicoloratus]